MSTTDGQPTTARVFRWPITDEDTLESREFHLAPYYYQRPGAMLDYERFREQARQDRQALRQALRQAEQSRAEQSRAEQFRAEQSMRAEQTDAARVRDNSLAQYYYRRGAILDDVDGHPAFQPRSEQVRQARRFSQAHQERQVRQDRQVRQVRQDRQEHQARQAAVLRQSKRIKKKASDNVELNECLNKTCPITQQRIKGYGIKLSDGQCYEPDAIGKWFSDNPFNHTTPLRAKYTNEDKQKLGDWVNRNSAGGRRSRRLSKKKCKVGKMQSRKNAKSQRKKSRRVRKTKRG